MTTLEERTLSRGNVLLYCPDHRIAVWVVSQTMAHCFNDLTRAAAIIILHYRKSDSEGRGGESFVLLEELSFEVRKLGVPECSDATGACSCLGARCSEISGVELATHHIC